MADDQITDKGYPDLPSGWYDVQVSAGTDVQADTLREGWQTELSRLQLLDSSFPAQRLEAMRLLVQSPTLGADVLLRRGVLQACGAP